jgi:hypothetical protein
MKTRVARTIMNLVRTLLIAAVIAELYRRDANSVSPQAELIEGIRSRPDQHCAGQWG